MQPSVIDSTSLENSENLESETQKVFDELANDPYSWAIAVANFVTRNELQDRLVLIELLKSHQRRTGRLDR
jgi:hypothetical protein